MAKSKSPSFPAKLLLVGIIVAVFLVFAAAVFGLFLFDINSPTDGEMPYSFYLRKGSNRIRSIKSDELICENGQFYLSPETLAEYCSYGIYGDENTKTLVFPNGSYAKFSGGNSFCLDGENKFLSNSCKRVGKKLLIPLEFYENYIDGLLFDYQQTETKLVVDIKVNVDDYQLISRTPTAEDALSVSDYFDNVYSPRSSSVEFRTDLSAYEEYMNPADRDKYLFLVNTENTLAKDYLPAQLTDLVHTRRDGRNTQQMELYAAKAMEAMLKEAAAYGYTSLSITSGYRSYNYQQQLFDNQVAALRPSYGDRAREKAAQAVALPGTSEHQSGLCCDLHNLPSASQAFANTEEYHWLLQNCAKFGFILRYPKDKTDITKIMFEPWHYRYVGRYHAQIIMSEGLCLEEYMAQIQ